MSQYNQYWWHYTHKRKNAVEKATIKIHKNRVVQNQTFSSLYELKYKLADYVKWFNNDRIHSSLGYLTPREYPLNTIKSCLVY